MSTQVITAIIGGMAAIITAIISLISALLSPTQPNSFFSTPTPYPQAVTTQLASLGTEIQSLRQELDLLNQTIEANPNASPETLAVQADIKSLDNRLSAIENTILDNPAKALEITLLSRDVDNLRATYNADNERMKQEIERVYSQSNWFIGLMFTMALGLLSLAIGSFMRKPEKDEVREPKTIYTSQTRESSASVKPSPPRPSEMPASITSPQEKDLPKIDTSKEKDGG